MTLLTTAILIGLAVDGLVAWQLGGTKGSGTLAGFAVGAAVTGWSVVRQRRTIRNAPAAALRAMMEGFVVKLGVVIVSALALVLIAPLRAVLDWRAFLVSFAAAVLVVLLPGTWENAGLLRERRTS